MILFKIVGIIFLLFVICFIAIVIEESFLGGRRRRKLEREARAKQLVLILIVLLFSGCAAVPKPPLTGLIPGKEMETLQSAVNITVTTADRSFGGRGFLIFRRPDRFHLAVLSPFGSPLVEVYSDGERFTCLVPSRQTAYSGLIEELPDRDGLKAWSLMRWVVERTPAAGPALTRVNVNGAGGVNCSPSTAGGFWSRSGPKPGIWWFSGITMFWMVSLLLNLSS